MFTIDTLPIFTVRVGMACCDADRYRLLGPKSDHRNCLDNMFSAMKAFHKAPPKAILASFNIFMNREVLDNRRNLETRPTLWRPSDYITLRPEIDCYVALSACPQDIVPMQGRPDLKPQDIEISY